MTDPDFPGKKIRDIIDSEVSNIKHVFIEKEKPLVKEMLALNMLKTKI